MWEESCYLWMRPSPDQGPEAVWSGESELSWAEQSRGVHSLHCSFLTTSCFRILLLWLSPPWRIRPDLELWAKITPFTLKLLLSKAFYQNFRKRNWASRASWMLGKHSATLPSQPLPPQPLCLLFLVFCPPNQLCTPMLLVSVTLYDLDLLPCSY